MILRRTFFRAFKNFQKYVNVASPKSSPQTIFYTHNIKSSFAVQKSSLKEETTQFFVPPRREPFGPKDDPNEVFSYVQPTKEQLLALFGIHYLYDLK